jgi:Zn finger protein HypA/HybF involved in hydrogenase expression
MKYLFENNGKFFIHHHKKPWNCNITEENKMAKCPKCGTENSKPKKTWKMAGRPDKQGKRMQLEIGLYECSKCHASYREVLSKKKI